MILTTVQRVEFLGTVSIPAMTVSYRCRQKIYVQLPLSRKKILNYGAVDIGPMTIYNQLGIKVSTERRALSAILMSSGRHDPHPHKHMVILGALQLGQLCSNILGSTGPTLRESGAVS